MRDDDAPVRTIRNLILTIFLCLIPQLMLAVGVLGKDDGRAPAPRELYRWRDDRGTFHITDNVAKIPAKYRSKAEKFESAGGVEPAPSLPQQDIRGGAPRRTPEEQAEETRRALWRRRLTEWRNRLANAEKRLSVLEKKREEALGRWGGAASGRRNGVQEALQIEQEMKAVQEEIDEARNQIDVVIPEDARKAGVPPGWLRE